MIFETLLLWQAPGVCASQISSGFRACGFTGGAAEIGGAHCIALNAADEIAVAAFLERRIPFMGIPRTIEAVLELTTESHPASIQEVSLT